MSPITGRDFRSELAQSPRSAQALSRALESSWLDPAKIHHDSAKLRNLIFEAQESIAGNLKIPRENLEFVGELGFGFWMAVAGLLRNNNRPFIYCDCDRQIVHAFAREEQAREIIKIEIDGAGLADYSNPNLPTNSVLSWQATNRETGVMQRPSTRDDFQVFVDMTASSTPDRLPKNWSVALWNPRQFAGPEGIAILAINESSTWQSPLPKIDNRRTFGSYSKAALISAAIALEDWLSEERRRAKHIAELNLRLRKELSTRLQMFKIAGNPESSDPRYLALAIEEIVAEELLRRLDSNDFKIDAGSACGGGALSPSHVLNAMGLGENGHIRIALKKEHSQRDVIDLAIRISDAVSELRG
ncbi:MAG: hypothetical protein ACKN8W_00025 [Actinomycetales bacterium]